MSEPSPKEWTVKDSLVPGVKNACESNGCCLFTGEAEYVEQAVREHNAHAALVEACQEFLVVLSFASKEMAMSPEKLAECKTKVRAALAAAEPKEA